MNNFLNNLVEVSGNEDATSVDSGLVSDIKGFISTGSYTLNALLSGSLYGGIPNNKITALAGEQATGKTFFCFNILKTFLDDNPEGVVLYFDSEQAITSQMFDERGIDSARVAVFPVSTIEEFRHQMIQVADSYRAEKDKKPILVILDSLGNLSTLKEMEDTASGKNVRDMTKAQALKATFRTLTVKCGSAGIPLLITNHTYDVVGSYVPMKEMSGGSGLKYNAGTIVFLSKKKVKDGTDVVGNIIKCKLQKSRVTKENSMAETLLNYESGLSPYYGLTEIAVKHGVFKKVSTRIELPDGRKVFEKNINDKPEDFFTDEIMGKLENAVAKEFKYGSAVEEEEIGVEDVTDEV